VMNMVPLSIMQIGAALSRAVNLKTKPVCVYGSDRVPEKGIRSASIGHCLASSMYKIAVGLINDPVYVGNEPNQLFCRCIGGPAWFGYCSFDPSLPGLMSTGSRMTDCAPKHLKENEKIALETYKAVGRITPLGKYAIMRSCDDMHEDPGVKCLVCFASGEQVRDLCALAHFGSRDVFNSISIPWGPACATLVTYPAGMAESASPDRIYIGPPDPSAREWLPENYMAMGIPAGIARMMAKDWARSFLAKRCQVR
jgi:hypothetical protein